MTKNFEEKGFWWLAEHPDEKFLGIITYRPTQGAILELLFNSELPRSIFRNKFSPIKKINLILGNAGDKILTLYI